MISEERLKLFVDDKHIYDFYLGGFDINVKYNSPLRQDPKPSFQIKKSKDGNLYCKDYGLSEQKGFNAISFVMHLYEIDREEAVKKIWDDMVISGEPISNVRVSPDTSKIPYKFFYSELRDWELLYWSKLGISKNILDLYKVKSLTGLYKTDRLVWKSVEDNPAYIYLYTDPKAFKCYRPLDKADKFRGQDNGNIIEGYDQLPDEWEHLVITKSTKDIMLLRSFGVVSCSPTSENSFNTLYNRAEELNGRFSIIYVMYDNDEPGIRAANKICAETGWKNIMFPKSFAKDPSDFIMYGGDKRKLEKFFSKLKLMK